MYTVNGAKLHTHTHTERDDLKQKCEELEGQLHEVVERNRILTSENEEIPILRDSVEEMKYMESKVVR